MEAQEARRTAIALRKADDVEGAVAFVDRQLHLHPSWSDPLMLQIRGRALIDLAKKSMNTARKHAITPLLRRNAWDQTRRYLERAERDLREAAQHADEGLLEWLRKDLEFLEEMKRRAAPPQKRHPRDGSPRRRR